MVRQERDRRGSEPGGDPQEPGHLAELAEAAPTEARRNAARKLVENEQRTQAKLDQSAVRSRYRENIEQLMRSEWREPVIVLYLGDVTELGFDVPGRRLDGTVKGKRLVRRFFWNIARLVGGITLNLFAMSAGSGPGNPFKRDIRVTGPENAMALDLLDKIRKAQGPWLVLSPSHLAVVDTGSVSTDPVDAAPPRILWQASKPHCPDVSFRTDTITWPDGSKFSIPLDGYERPHLRKYYEFPGIFHWQGRPGVS